MDHMSLATAFVSAAAHRHAAAHEAASNTSNGGGAFRDSSGSFLHSSREEEVVWAPHQGNGHTPPTTSSAPPPLAAIPDLTDEPLALAPLPNELRDRTRLMRHITYLSSVAQRLQLELHLVRGTPHPAVADDQSDGDTHRHLELQSRFDPVVAETQIRRLEGLLAQQSLLREADHQTHVALEADHERFRAERAKLIERLQQLENAAAEAEHMADTMRAMDVAFRQLQEQSQLQQGMVKALELENRKLRRTVKQLRTAGNGNVHAHAYAGSASVPWRDDDDGTAVIDDNHEDDEGEGEDGGEPPERALPSQRQQPPWMMTVSPTTTSAGREEARMERILLEMDETAARQDLFIEDFFFKPLRIALEAAVAFRAEEERVAEAHRWRDLDVPPPPLVGVVEQHQQQQQQQDVLLLQSDLEVLRQQHLFLQSHVQRCERLLEAERLRNTSLLREHQAQLEAVHTRLIDERREYLEKLAQEVQHAFREGAAKERAARTAKRDARRRREEMQLTQPQTVQSAVCMSSRPQPQMHHSIQPSVTAAGATTTTSSAAPFNRNTSVPPCGAEHQGKGEVDRAAVDGHYDDSGTLSATASSDTTTPPPSGNNSP